MTQILVVEDEKITREYVKYVIVENKLDVEVYEASNGMRAIEIVKEIQPDLVIIDIQMSELDGLAASRVIKEEIPWVKIIILTAYDQFNYAHEAVKIQVDDYLLKPISPTELIEAVTKVLSKKVLKVKENIIDVNEYRSLNETNIHKAIDYISDNYNKKLYLKDVANIVGYSETYFSKIFKKVAQKKFSDFLNHHRIEKSKELMSDFQLSLGEIANRVGYEDFSYYSNVFNKYEGMAPSEFRKKINEMSGNYK